VDSAKDFFPFRLDRDPDCRRFRGISDGIVKQVVKDLSQAVWIPKYPIPWIRLCPAWIHYQRYPGLISQGRKVFAARTGHGFQINLLYIQTQFPGICPGEEQLVVDQPDQAVCFAMHGGQEGTATFQVIHSAIFEGLDGALDDGQGRAQLVGDIGDKGIPDLVGMTQAGRHLVKRLTESL